MQHKGFFSISFTMLVIDQIIPFDLFINSSSVASREKYVRIFPKGEILTRQDLAAFMAKYPGIYVAEEDRQVFLDNLCTVNGATVAEKAVVLKETALHHIENVFESGGNIEVVNTSLTGFKDVMDNMIDVLADYNVENLGELMANLSYHDFYTYNHSINVSIYSMMLYKSFNPGATREKVFLAGMGGLLHDLGKSCTPTELLNKSERLTDEEFNEIKRHPQVGYDLLKQVNPAIQQQLNMEVLLRVVHEHHENYDGTGYPQRLPADKQHLLARIVAIADFFDAVTTKRPYHEPRSTEQALALMAKSAGTKLDPHLFKLFETRLLHRADEEVALLPPDFEPHPESKPVIELKPHAEMAAPGKVGPSAPGYGKIKVIASTRDAASLKGSGNIAVIDSAKLRARPGLKKRTA